MSAGAGQEVGVFIDGVLASSASRRGVDVFNPSTGQRLFCIPAGSEEDVDRAVASCRQAWDRGDWSEAPPSFRKKVLHRLADLIEAEARSLDALDALEMGKPLSVSRANAMSAAGQMRFYAEAIDKAGGQVHASDKFSLVMQRRTSRGVVAAVTPWNFPTFNAVLKIAPALAAGNCVVLKPSELSSCSAMRLVHLAMEAGLPPGTLNLVPGLGETSGRALALHMDVDMLTFTGSTSVGKLMLQYSGQSNLKAVMAECGGKSPQVVFADGVNLDAAAQAIATMLLTNQGQICTVGSRLLVQRSIEADLVEKIMTRFGQAVIGDPLDPATTFGPVVSSKQCARVMAYIEGAQQDGAQLALGGRRTLEDSGGYFIEPTVFRGVSPKARIAQEEIFGPVLSVIPFDDEVEAARIANDTAYGLAAYVWTADLARGMRMAKAIRSPICINAAAPQGEGAGRAISYEPAGLSGIGIEGGLAGLESYMRNQLVIFNYA